MSLLITLIDGHAHSQYSWDASEGSMLGSCDRAAELGLAGIAFTEHADLTDWIFPADAQIKPGWRRHVDGRTMRLPAIDVEPYLATVAECRARHPRLSILSGVEISEPHWHRAEVAALLADGDFDRVISSVHACAVDDGACEVSALFGERPACDVMRDYLAEVLRMVESVDVRVLGHIDYAARYWPQAAGAFSVLEFELEYRRILTALAERDGALEINTRGPLDPRIVAWWVEENGRAVTFGSDSHAPGSVGQGLREAAQVAARLGFSPSARPADPWRQPG